MPSKLFPSWEGLFSTKNHFVVKYKEKLQNTKERFWIKVDKIKFFMIGTTLLCTASIGCSVALGYTSEQESASMSQLQRVKTINVPHVEEVGKNETIVLPVRTKKVQEEIIHDAEIEQQEPARSSYSSNSRLSATHISYESNTAGTQPYTFNARSSSNVTAYELDKFLKGTNLAGLGHAFVKAELNTGINAMFLASLATIESGWGNSDIAKTKNNIFGFNAVDSSPYESASTFSSKEECIAKVSRYIAKNYCSPNGRYYKGGTISDIGSLYASNPEWANMVHNQMVVMDKEMGKS